MINVRSIATLCRRPMSSVSSSGSSKPPSSEDELAKKMKLDPGDSVGITRKDHSHRYINPLLTPPPRSPKTPEDFLHPERLGHWVPLGFDYTNPVADRYLANEAMAVLVIGFMWGLWFYSYSPDLKLKNWARREAFLRTHKREALGLPLIEKDLVDPDRVHLPSEEELAEVEGVNFVIQY